MKSKYSPVLKIKEQKVNDIEIRLFNARASKSSLENSLNELKNSANSQEFPKSGNWADLQLVIAINESRKDEIEMIKEKIALTNNQIYQLENAYKEAYKDKEKIKFLHSTEIENTIKKLAHKSQTELDELAVMGFFRRHRDEQNS